MRNVAAICLAAFAAAVLPLLSISPAMAQSASSAPDGGIIFWWCVVALAIFWIVGAIRRRTKVRRAAGQKAVAIIKQHLPSLIRRREQLVRHDAYGKPLLENWIKEVSYFIKEHIKPSLTPEEQSALVREQTKIAQAIYIGLLQSEKEKNALEFERSALNS